MDKQKIESYVKWGAAAVIIGVGGFIGAFVIKSIVMLAIIGILGLVAVNAAPLLSQYLAYGRIKATLWGAAKNPIEELVLQYQEKHEILQKTAEAVTAFGRETQDYGSKLKEFSRKRPDKAQTFEETYLKMRFVLDKRLQALTTARAELKKFEGVIDEARDVWDMTQAAIKANKLLSKFTQRDPMQEIREKTALDSVYGSLNQVMAELDTAMAMDYTAIEQTPPALTHQPAEVIDLPVMEKSRVSTGR